MKSFCAGLGALAACLALSVPAFGFGGPNPNPKAVANCESQIVSQTSDGVQAGGGPKAAYPAPLNCDHYWQTSGDIGNGTPGP
jgi:hypothetical protein